MFRKSIERRSAGCRQGSEAGWIFENHISQKMRIELRVSDIELYVRGDEAHTTKDFLSQQPNTIPDEFSSVLNGQLFDLILDRELAVWSRTGNVVFVQPAVAPAAAG